MITTLECGIHNNDYQCSRCGKCYTCTHRQPHNGYWQCPDGFIKMALPDRGQWANNIS